MKKITFFMTLLLLFAGVTTAAHAQAFKALTTAVDQSSAVTSLSAITEGDYVLYNNGRSRYLKYNAVDGNMSVSASIDVTSIEAGLYVFHIKPVTTDGVTKYTIKTAVGDYYMPETKASANSTPVSATEETAYQFTIEELDATNHYFGIKTTAGVYFNGNPNDFVGWTGNGDNSRFKIIPVTTTDAAAAVVTENLTYNDNVYTTKYVKTFGTQFSAFVTPRSSYFTFDYTDAAVGENSYTLNVTVTKGTAPVTFGTWYAMNTRGGDHKYACADATTTTIDNVAHYYVDGSFEITSATTYDQFCRSLWQFEESGWGVKIKNKASGKYLSSNGDVTATGTVFYFNTANDGYDFTLCNGVENTTTYFGNHANPSGHGYSGWYGNGGFCNWTDGSASSDAGSQFKVRAVDTDADLLALGKTCAKNSPLAADETYLSAGTDLSASASAIEAATTLADLDVAYKAALETVVPDVNAYYRLINCNGINNKYVTTANLSVDKDGTMLTAYNTDSSIDRKLCRVDAATPLVPQLFQLVASSTSGEYFLKSANIGMRVGISAGSDLDIPTLDSYVTQAITLSANTTVQTGTDKYVKLQMKFGTHIINAFNGNSGTTLKNYDDASDEGGYWKFEKISSIPVSIGETGFTGVCYPFAVQIPEGSSVKAYYGSQFADGAVLLAELADGVIPANTAAVLYNESGSADVDLAITTTDNTVTNALSGTTARRINFDESSTYGLGKTSSGDVAFMVNTATAVPANKPYIEKSTSGSTTSAISLSFGKVDGIGAATMEDGNAKSVKYFDLNGRPVLYPVHGLYITDKGQKVLVP